MRRIRRCRSELKVQQCESLYELEGEIKHEDRCKTTYKTEDETTNEDKCMTKHDDKCKTCL